MLTLKEIDAVRYYQGDIRKRDKNDQIVKDEIQEGFWGIPSAYLTMNCLMFDGVINEQNRILEGNGKIVPELLLEIEKIIEVFCDIYRAMCKYVSELESDKKMLTFRTDRKVSVEEMKKGYTVSFVSTSKNAIPEEFFQRKTELVLLNFAFPQKIPHLDFSKILKEDYLFKEQEEVLLPPFLKIELEKMELTEREKLYCDINGQSPCAKYFAEVKGIGGRNLEDEEQKRKILDSGRNRRSAEILKKMINREIVTEEEKQEYSLWKRNFQWIVWRRFKIIEKEYLEGDLT